MKRAIFILGMAAFGLSGFVSAWASNDFAEEERERAMLLLEFDADQDGTVTRAEMDSGIRAEFAAADTDGDGKLNGAERRAVNETRVSEGQNSPLMDWNADGFVDYKEFSNVLTTLFGRLDEDDDDQVSESEFASIKIEAARNSKAATLIPSVPSERGGKVPATIPGGEILSTGRH